MPRYPKPPLAARVTDHLRNEIISGQRRGELSGIRLLMKEFRVSKSTMMFALRGLEESGFLHPAEPGRARKILPVKGQGTIVSANRPSRVIMITHRPKDRLYKTDLDMLTNIKKKIIHARRSFECVSFPQILQASGVDGLNELLFRHPADLYLVVRAHQQCATWLAQSSVPVIFLGGDLTQECQPRVSYQLEEMVSPVIEKLVQLGHHRIVYMQPEEYFSESPETSSQSQIIQKLLMENGVAASPFHCPQWGTSRDDFWENLKRYKLTPPTALILSEPWMITLCFSFFIRYGFRYPEDISLVCLERSPLFADCYPEISCVIKSIGNYTSKVMSQIDQILLKGRNKPQRSIIEVTMFHETGSIGLSSDH